MPPEYHLSDWRRLLIGQTPMTFLIEVGIRAIITYVILLITMRLMGRRVAGQMSALEMTIVVTLGAAIGVPMQAPERGMVPAVIILLVAVAYQRGLNFWAFKSRRAEITLQGDVSTVVSEGCLNLGAMQHSVISRERLYSVLRQAGMVHLGQAKRVYMEADGHFSIFKNDDPPPGLCLMPEADLDLFEQQYKVPKAFACRSCGQVLHDQSQPPGQCPRCQWEHWSPAVQTMTLGRLKLAEELKA